MLAGRQKTANKYYNSIPVKRKGDFLKIAGIIAEYNPFHKGHAYHIEQTRLQTGADCIICLMSGSFVQRGEPAFMDKFARTHAALLSGADMVLELPVFYALQAAKYFAMGGVRILDSLNICDILSFGREGQSLPVMREDAQTRFKRGISYPSAAYEAALPNDVLAAEYIRAIEETNADLEPFWIRRKGAHDELSLASALGIRRAVRMGEDITGVLPNGSAEVLKEQITKSRVPWKEDALFRLICARARVMSAQKLNTFSGADEGLEYRLKRAAEQAINLEELINLLKSKRYTRARICRFLMCVLLGIKKEHIHLANRNVPYIRCLGVRGDKKDLLSLCARSSKIPFYTSGVQLKRAGGELFELEMRATDIYELLLQEPGRGSRDMTEGLIVL